MLHAFPNETILPSTGGQDIHRPLWYAGSRLVVDRLSEVFERKVVENVMTVVVKDPQVVLLPKVTHDHVEMVSVLLFRRLH